jgi:hypothetical protein
MPDIDIHHIDSNRSNNHPSNLQAVTLAEHYDIHKKQNDYYACVMIAKRMLIKPEDWHDIAKLNSRKVAFDNIQKGVGLIHWYRNNPDLARVSSSNGGKIAGKKCFDEKIGIHSLSQEEKRSIASLGGKTAAELGLGFKAGHASRAGKVGGKKGGAYAKENRTGIFSLTPEQIKAKGQKAAITKLIKNGKASAWPRKEV